MEEKVIETRTAKMWWGEEGIFRYSYYPNAEIRLEDAKEQIAHQSRLTKGKKTPVLVDITRLKAITREARAYFAGSESAKVISASALLIGSPVSKVLGNFFIGINKTSYPSRLFTSEEKAVEWLKGFGQ